MTEWDYPRQIGPGGEYEKHENVERFKVHPDPEPEFMGEPWGISDHVPRAFKRFWDEVAQTYLPVEGDDGDY